MNSFRYKPKLKNGFIMMKCTIYKERKNIPSPLILIFMKSTQCNMYYLITKVMM